MNRRAKRRLLLLSVLAILGASVLVGWSVFASWNKERRIQASIDSGMQAYEEGDYVNALNRLRYAVIHRPGDKEILLAFADSRLRNIDPKGKRGHVQSAIKHYEKVLEIDPGNQEALNSLFEIHATSGRISDALSTVRKLNELDSETLLKKALLEERSGDTESALETLSELKDRDPADSRWVIAEYALRQRMGDDPAKMMTIFEGHAEVHSSNDAVSLVRLILHRKLNQDEPAREIALQLADRDSIDSDLLIDLRFQVKRLGLEDAHGKIEDKISKTTEIDPGLAFNLIQLDWRRGAVENALDLSVRSARNFPDDLRFLRSALLLHRLANPAGRDDMIEGELISKSEAMDTAAAVLDSALIELVASLDEESGDTPVETLGHLARVRALDDGSAYSQFIVIFEGLMLEKSGRTKSAIDSYRGAFDKTNARLPGKLLVDAYLRDQDSDRAFATAKRMSSLFPSVDSTVLEYKTLLVLARTGRNVLSMDVGLNQAGSISESAKLKFNFWTAQAQNASALLPIIAEAARIEENEQNLAFACEQAIANREITADELLRIAQFIKSGTPIHGQLLERSKDRGGSEFEIRLSRNMSESDVVKRVEGLLQLEELAGSMPIGSAARTDAYRSLLVQHAINEVPWETKAAAINALHGELTDDIQTAKFILNIPDIWAKEQELAQSSLELLKQTLGTDSPIFVLADARRVLQNPETDQRTRAMAMVAVDRVIRDSTESIEASLIMSSLLQSGTEPDFRQAVVYLRRVLDLRPDLVNLYPSAINLLQITGDGALALEYLEQYRELVIRDTDIARLRATILAKQGDVSNAVSEFSRLIETQGQLIDRIYLGGLLAQIELNEAAIEQYDIVLEEEPENVLAMLRKATTLAAMGMESQGLTVIEEAKSLSEDERLRYEILVHRSSGNLQEALTKVDRLVQIAPTDIKSWLTMYEVYQNSDMTEKRLEAIDQVLELDPENIDALTYKAIEFMKIDGPKGRVAGSIEALKQVLPARGEILELRMAATDGNSGLLRPSRSQVEAAEEILSERPTSPDANKLAWDMYMGSGDHVSALLVAKNAITTMPSSILPHQWAIESALAARYWDEAIELAETARARLSPSERAMHDLKTAELCLALGYDTRALRTIERFLPFISDRDLIVQEAGSTARIPGNYPEMVRMTALKALLAADRSQQAFNLYEDLIREDPEMLDVWVVATSMTQPYEARRAIERIEPILLASPEGRVMQVKALLVIAEKSEDEADILRALESIDRAVIGQGEIEKLELDLYRSTLLNLSGRIDESIQTLETIVKTLDEASLNPVINDDESNVDLYVTALNNLAYLHTLRGIDGSDNASRSIIKALAIAPDRYRSALLDTKALIDLKAGDCDGAEASIAQAISDRPENLDYRFRLIEILIGCDKLEEAEVYSLSIQEQMLSAPQMDVKGLDRISTLLDQIQTSVKMN